MNISDFSEISMNGRMAYVILCIEKYVQSLFPDDDWSELAERMWEATSSYWDEWDNKFIEIIPEYLFEFESYEDSGFEELSKEDYLYFTALLKNKPQELNLLLLKLHKIQEVYCCSSVPKHGEEASAIVLEACKILESRGIELPDINTVKFSEFSEKNGWGNCFDGTKLSLILNSR